MCIRDRKQYHLAPSEDSIKALRLAVIGWMGTKGKWQLSTRNRHGTVTRLVQAIGLQPDMRPPLDAESLFLMKRGIDIVEAETSEIVAKLFQGARLEWKASIAKSEIVFDQQYIDALKPRCCKRPSNDFEQTLRLRQRRMVDL